MGEGEGEGEGEQEGGGEAVIVEGVLVDDNGVELEYVEGDKDKEYEEEEEEDHWSDDLEEEEKEEGEGKEKEEGVGVGVGGYNSIEEEITRIKPVLLDDNLMELTKGKCIYSVYIVYI